jgi:type III restriction enzyme
MPLMFVMAENTKAADQITRYLDTINDLAGHVLTLHVNLSGQNKGQIRNDELDLAREAARSVDRVDSPYRAIVSVLMLREGWDVRNVTVVVPLRPLTAKSQILPEQTLGRGLRRMTPPGSGADESVVVIEHEAFRGLWDKVLDDAEYSGIERDNIGDTGPRGEIVAVTPERLAHDIVIPLLPRILSRSATPLSALRVSDVSERALRLPEELRTDTVDYLGRDMLSGAVVERATFPIPRPENWPSILAWFVNEIQRDARLTGQFAVLAPIVRGWIESRAFGGPVEATEPLVLQALSEPEIRETVLAVFREAVDAVTLTTSAVDAGLVKELRLSSTRPFLWSRTTYPALKSVFSTQPCDSELEVDFCAFLDRAADVESFAKLARPVRFSLEYRGHEGRLAYYYPDFVARTMNGENYLLETKGLVDEAVPAKDDRAGRWAVDASVASQTRWSYLRIDEEPFRMHEASLDSLAGLVSLVYTMRRERLLADRAVPREMSRDEAFAKLEEIRAKLRGVTGVDEALDRFREDRRD